MNVVAELALGLLPMVPAALYVPRTRRAYRHLMDTMHTHGHSHALAKAHSEWSNVRAVAVVITVLGCLISMLLFIQFSGVQWQ